MSRKNYNQQYFERFKSYELSPNTAGSANIFISTDPNNPTILASLSIRANVYEPIQLTATVGWRPEEADTNILFKIWRNDPANPTLIFSVLVGGESENERNYISSFSHVDTNLPQNLGEYVYVLTAENVSRTTANVLGPVTFSVSQVDLD